MNLRELATRAVRAAARLRADHGVGAADAVCPFDLAQKAEILARLTALPSVEGVYSPAPRATVVVNSERPAGRRRFTCAHEIGHHVFQHGAWVDELASEDEGRSGWSPEEFLASRFASALLMPKLAVESAFTRRGWRVCTSRPEEIYVVAQDLGVGYTTLVGHLATTLGRISASAADALRRVRLPVLRSRIAGFQVEHDLVAVDDHWGRRPIDIEVGDVVLLTGAAAFGGTCATYVDGPVPHLMAVAPGTGELGLRHVHSLVRVSRRAFAGLARYRFLEEASEDG